MDFYITWAICVIAVWTSWGILFAISKYMEKHKAKIENLKLKASNYNPKENINKEIDRIFFGDLSSENKYLEEWDNIKSPLMIGYLCDGKVKYRHIIANLLNFIQKGYIEIIQINKKDNKIDYKLIKKNLEIYNPKVYESLKSLKNNNALRKKLIHYEVSSSDIFVINRIIFNDNNEIKPEDIIKFYDDKDCDGKESEELIAKLIYLEKLINKEFEIYGLIEKNSTTINSYRGKLTNIGIVKRNEWLNIANKLKTQTLISNRDTQGILVWGKYMAYAVALNVSKIAINDLWDKLFDSYNKNIDKT